MTLENCYINYSGNELFNYWRSNNCHQLLVDFLNTKADGTYGYNIDHIRRSRTLMNLLYLNYLKTNNITDIGESGYNIFQDNILRLCTDNRLPGICEVFLESYCHGLDRNTVSDSVNLSNYCGCYVERDPTYNEMVPRSCDPLCHRSTTVQISNEKTGTFNRCPDTVCVIDNVTIKINGGTGNVKFNQICNCAQGCKCVISNTSLIKSLDITNSECGNESRCIDGNKESVCSFVTSDTTGIMVLIIVGIIIVVIILAFIFYKRI